jgi:hypothetical protein
MTADATAIWLALSDWLGGSCVLQATTAKTALTTAAAGTTRAFIEDLRLLTRALVTSAGPRSGFPNGTPLLLA